MQRHKLRACSASNCESLGGEGDCDTVGADLESAGSDSEREIIGVDLDTSTDAYGHDGVRQGPISLEGVLNVLPNRVREICGGLSGESKAKLSVLFQAGFVLSSCFSGTGIFEASTHQVLSLVAHYFGFQLGVLLCYSVTETKVCAVKALSGHPRCTRAKHFFGNVLDRLYDSDRERLTNIMTPILEEWRCTKEEQKLGNVTKSYVASEKRRLTASLISALIADFERIDFKECGSDESARCHTSGETSGQTFIMFWERLPLELGC